MPSLSQTQGSFARALLDPSDPAPQDVRRPAGADATAPQTRRFDIYRNNVAVAAIDALGETFPAVRALVGEEFFRATARAYLTQSPPRSPLLFRYGATFGDFLQTFPPAARSVPYLADVARFEFARLQAFHAPDAAPLSIAALGEIDPARVASVTFSVHPSVSLSRSGYPVVSLWAASTGLMTSDQVDMGRAEDGLVVRPHLQVDSHILPPGGGPFLAALIAGKNLATAAEAGGAAVPDFDLSTHLAGLFETGAIAGVLPPPADSVQPNAAPRAGL